MSRKKSKNQKKKSKSKKVIAKQAPPAYSKRLSSIGSSFLKLCVTNVLFQSFPNYNEEKLTKLIKTKLPQLRRKLKSYSNGGRFQTCAYIGNYVFLNGATLASIFLKNHIPIEGQQINMRPAIMSPSMHSIYHEKQFQKLEEQIGYKFQNQFYLLQAFTRGSHEFSKYNGTYQRLEFLGDAVLEYLISQYLYNHASTLAYSQIAAFRSKFTTNVTFATLTLKNGLQNYILQSSKNPIGQKCCADIFESLAAAIYIDSGMNLDIVWKIFYQLMKKFDDFDKLDSAHASICVTQ